MLAGNDHGHWDVLRELLTLYMTGPESLKSILVGPEGDKPNKGMFALAGTDQCLIFMSRRTDYRIKTNAGWKKRPWTVELLNDLGMKDPSEKPVNFSLYSAEVNQRVNRQINRSTT